MTTGAPLYLVSACGSAEEFVAAFRRYADRTGLFVPSASPLPAGRRGRLALTLKDGGGRIEGEAEILQSSTRPTVLHGRPGMTVKFIEPDEPSKQVIGDLEKARLALKPAPPTMGPRPAVIPAEPRPVPPTPSGRIDAANALAECIVIGDVSTLRETATMPRGLGSSANDRSGAKFVVPAIPAIGAPRAKTPSAAPAPTPTAPPAPAPAPRPASAAADASAPASTPADADRSGPTVTAKPPAISTRMTSIGLPVLDKLPAKSESGRVVSNSTTLGMPALDRKPEAVTPPATPPAVETAAASTNVHDVPTAVGETPVKRTTDPTIRAAPIIEPIGDDEMTAIGVVPTKADPTPPPTPPRDEASAARRLELAKHHKATSIGFPAMRTPFQTQPLGVVAAPPTGAFDPPAEPSAPTLPKSGRFPAPGPRGKAPTTPPLTPRHPTPVAPVPIVRPPAKTAAPAAGADDEKTDLGSAPPITASIDAADGSGAVQAPEPKAQRSGGMRASEILAAIPAGDWTMTPDESMPHPLPSDAKLGAPAPAEPTPAPAAPPKGPPTGDWTISLDPDSGWSEPEKVTKSATSSSGNPVVAISSDRPIDVVQWEEKPTSVGESKIEIDSTLIAASEPAGDASGSQSALAGTAASSSDMLPPPLGPTPTMPPPLPPAAAAARPVTPYPVQTLNVRGYTGTAVGAPASRKKMIAMAIGAGAVAVGAIVILVLTLSSAKQTQANASTGSEGSAPAVTAEPAVQTPEPQLAEPTEDTRDDEPEGSADDAEPAVATDPEPDKPAVGGPCKVEVTSIPDGANVYLGSRKLGTTPTEIELACGKRTKLSLRKAKYSNALRSITPKANEDNKLVVKLGHGTVSVKVTSTPAGATIKAGRRTMGVTPTTIKLPAFETTTLTLTKPGYATKTQRISPRRNNTSQHVMLKKGRR